MAKSGESAVKSRFRSVFDRLKGRRSLHTDPPTTAANMAAACVSDASDPDSHMETITAGVDGMEIDKSANIRLPIPPSGTFDFTPPPSSPAWPGPRYDELVAVSPNLFNRSNDMLLSKIKPKPKPKRTIVKRSSSHDFKSPSSPSHSHNQRRLNGKITKPGAAASKKRGQSTASKRPAFCRPPPTRAEPLHLLTLPGEIRNQIYQYLFLSKEPLKAHYRPILHPHQGINGKPEIKRFPREPTLALVNRQLHLEACSFFYAENTFIFASRDRYVTDFPDPEIPPSLTSPTALVQWMDASAATRSLRKIELHLGPVGSLFDYSYRTSPKYTFLRKADGGTEVELQSDYQNMCMCLEKEICADAQPAMVAKHCGGQSLLLAAKVLVVRRIDTLRELKLERSGKVCERCGELGFRRVEEDS